MKPIFYIIFDILIAVILVSLCVVIVVSDYVQPTEEAPQVSVTDHVVLEAVDYDDVISVSEAHDPFFLYLEAKTQIS